MRWRLRGSLLCLLIAVVAITVMPGRGDASIVRQFIYQPDRLPAKLDWGILPPPEQIAVRTEDGLQLLGFRWPAIERDHVTIVFFHGNAGNRYDAALMAAPLRRPDTEVIVASYRGYGGNPGKPSETGLYQDGAAFLKYARVSAPGRLYVFGFSLGAAVALHLAINQPVDGIVTLGAFSRLSAMAPVWARFLLPDRFDNIAAIRRLRVPHLLMHGSADDVVPFAESEKLLTASAGRSRFLPLKGAVHNIDLDAIAPVVLTTLDQMPSAEPKNGNAR